MTTMLVLMLSMLVLLQNCDSSILPLTEPSCPRSLGTSTGDQYFQIPQPSVGAVACSQYEEQMCCTDSQLERIAAGTDAIHSYMATALQPETISFECGALIDKLACSPCAPDSFVWLRWAYDDNFQFDVCSNFCKEFRDACGDAVVVVDGKNVSSMSADGFCYSIVNGIPSTYLNVLHDVRPCFDSEMRVCEEADIGYEYQPCSAGKRNLIYYWLPGTNCSGGVILPPSSQNLPCPIDCPKGQYLPIGSTSCSVCEAGTFSLGGARRVQSWDLFPLTHNEGIVFETYCTDLSGVHLASEDCSGWAAREFGSNSLIDSNIAGERNTISVLRTDVLLIEPGYVSFFVKVDCEWSYDRLTFKIDDDEEIWIQNQIEPEIVTFELSAGQHSLKWKFKKDYSLSHGEDRADIWWIEVGGLHDHSDYCYDCDAGYYSDAEASECLLCGENTVSSEKSPDCTPCESNEYSFPGDELCTLREPCTEDDIALIYTSCSESHDRIKQSIWEEPAICDPNHVNSVALPENETVECEACNPGQYRMGDDCINCPPGHWSIVGTTAECTPCEAGTYAPPVLNIDRFFEWEDFMSTHCTGLCGTSGWRLKGDYIDSGIDHGSNTESVLKIEVTIVEHVKNVVEYSIELDCGTSYCYLEVYIDSTLKNLHWGTTLLTTFSIDIDPGHHVIQFSFSKFLTDRDNEMAKLHDIIIWGSDMGGAHQCDDCLAGTSSTSAATYCEPCGPGTFSSLDKAPKCDSCPENTYNDETGVTACVPCGQNTYTPEGSSECSINNCIYHDGLNTYDLNGLSRDNNMWGPVDDPTDEHTFYINPCSKDHTNHTCYQSNGDPMITYICQHVGPWGYATNLGDVMGFSPIDPAEGYGVVLEFTDGTPGCGNEALDQPDVPRSAIVTVHCDPGAGIGVFEGENPIYQGTVYPHVCNYGLKLRSVYGCPVCTDTHYHARNGACIDGIQEITYEWNTNPKSCHGGVELPESDMYECSTSTICGKGQMATPENECVSCDDGFFSIGNGLVFENFDSLAPFTTECVGEQCQKFYPISGNLVSGTRGFSSLNTTQNFILESGSYVSFEYKFNGAAGSKFSFLVDEKEYFSISSRTFEYKRFTRNLSPGTHTITWTFEQSDNLSPEYYHARDSYVSISQISLEGLFGAIPFCYQCPQGLAPTSDKSGCTECGINTFSNGTSCQACPLNNYRLPGQESCAISPSCDKEIHFNAVYSDCISGKTTKSYLPVHPIICVGETPTPDEVDCRPCPLGTHLHDDQCKMCSDHTEGYYDFETDACVASPAGTEYYFTTYYDLGSLEELPSEFTTTCKGFCATYGWQLHNEELSPGTHYGEADVSLTLTTEISTTLVGNPGITFTVTAASNKRAIGENGLELFIDGEQQYFPFTHIGENEYHISLSPGIHEISWIYHAEGPGSLTTLTGIRVIGTLTGTASDPFPCPLGSANGEENGQCQLCIPGKYADSTGSTECKSCTGNTVSENSGAVVCSSCGDTARPNEGNLECITDCIFSSDSHTFDLSPLTTTYTLSAGKSNDYSVRVCEKIKETECKGTDCTTFKNYVFNTKYDGDYEYNYGMGALINFQSLPTNFNGINQTLHSFKLEFNHGTNVPPGCDDATSLIDFYCDLSKGIGFPTLVSHDNCNVHMTWDSKYACKVCIEGDYTIEKTECENGLQTEFAELLNTCIMPNDFSYETIECKSHSFNDTTLLIVVSVTAGLFLLLIIFGVFNYCQKRKFENSYEVILNQWNAENDEL